MLPDLEKLIEDFYCERKPIASICIASVLVARVLKGVKITLGKDGEFSRETFSQFHVLPPRSLNRRRYLLHQRFATTVFLQFTILSFSAGERLAARRCYQEGQKHGSENRDEKREGSDEM